MFSAVKHKGQPLYKLARQGIEIEREARAVTIYSNELVSFEGDEFEVETHCSKGTYVRAIAEEMGEMLGCGAHVSALRRSQAGPYGESDWSHSMNWRRHGNWGPWIRTCSPCGRRCGNGPKYR